LVSGKLSDVLLALSSDTERERISLAELLHVLSDRALATLIFLFALPNVIPTPPGTSAVLGVPLVILSAQLLLGAAPWLPRFIACRSIPMSTFKAVVDKALPWLKRSERLMRPRVSFMSSGVFQRLIGGVCLVLAILLMLPVPLGNMLPAFAICLLALGVLEQDGVWMLAGLLAAVAAIAVVWGVFYAAFKGLVLALSRL
jgi:hypothetical protein